MMRIEFDPGGRDAAEETIVQRQHPPDSPPAQIEPSLTFRPQLAQTLIHDPMQDGILVRHPLARVRTWLIKEMAVAVDPPDCSVASASSNSTSA